LAQVSEQPTAGPSVAAVLSDSSERLGVFLEERRRMYQQLCEDAVRVGTPAGDETLYEAYMELVHLVRTMRSAARKWHSCMDERFARSFAAEMDRFLDHQSKLFPF
jgi:hypothetical protein